MARIRRIYKGLGKVESICNDDVCKLSMLSIIYTIYSLYKGAAIPNPWHATELYGHRALES
jgi:hypothetical protein